jgi:hypothetical protein
MAAPRPENSNWDEKDALFGLDTQIIFFFHIIMKVAPFYTKNRSENSTFAGAAGRAYYNDVASKKYCINMSQASMSC